MKNWLFRAFLLVILGHTARAADLAVLPEFQRPDPFGGTVAADKGPPGVPTGKYDVKHPYQLTGARGGYVSFHLLVSMPEPGEYELSLQLLDKTARLEFDLFKEWFHFTDADRTYYPDALIPVSLPVRSRIPDPDNRIDKQTVQAFWVDVWIPADTPPGVYRARADLVAGKKRSQLPLAVNVLSATVPPEDVVVIDHNSYGSDWLSGYYGGIKVPSDESLRLIHLYHQLFYEHRGMYHQLGYGHGGKVISEFAPEIAGSGRSKHIKSWELYDRHYGPLLDGSAFAGSRRGAKPIPFVYLPVNPEWPASFLWWGEPGYETEFVNVVSEMERHFREKGWTSTRFEMFFNHKKRYKAYPWDGDETRFPEDDSYFREYGRLLKKAVPSDSPVKFVFRSDSSWSMEHQFKSLAGIVNFWVCGGGMFSWYPASVKLLKGRGDIVWLYGGSPGVDKVSTTITESPFRVWLYGVDGWLHWQTTSPGEDPWFHFGGGSEVLAYPGERFGVRGPIPSVRLKLQRNCAQDLALLDSFKSRIPIETLRAESAKKYNGSRLEDWWTPRPALADSPPYEWNNATIGDAERRPPKIDSSAWENVRAYIFELSQEGK